MLMERDPYMPGNAKKLIFIEAGHEVDSRMSTICFYWGKNSILFLITLLGYSPHVHVPHVNRGL